MRKNGSPLQQPAQRPRAAGQQAQQWRRQHDEPWMNPYLQEQPVAFFLEIPVSDFELIFPRDFSILVSDESAADCKGWYVK